LEIIISFIGYIVADWWYGASKVNFHHTVYCKALLWLHLLPEISINSKKYKQF
jgi:hypothetical protein